VTTVRDAPRGRTTTVQSRTGNPQGGSDFTTDQDFIPSQQTRQRTRTDQLPGAYRSFSPTRAGEKAGSSVGALEAEFLAAELIIFVGLFADTSTAYPDKILSIMKRSLLTGILFFFLALLSSAGPNAARAAKAFGGLITVTMLLTSPGIVSFIDNLSKQDFVSVGTSGAGTTGTSGNDTGTPASSPAANTASSSYAAAVNSLSAAQRASSAFMSNFTSDFINSWNIAHPGEVISSTANELSDAAKALSDAANAGTDFITSIFQKIF
jgi:hypothetical protein